MAALSLSIPEPQSFDGLLSLNGRCAVVTGGSRGLGKAIARRLTQASAAKIAAVTGHMSLEEIERYTRAACKAKLANAAIAKLKCG